MRRFLVVAAALMLVILPVQAFGQTSSASLGGTIMDASGAVLPRVVVTATNVATNIATKATSNTAGVYNFPSLQPGEYKVSAELAGFQTLTNTGVQLGTARQIRLNFTLEVRKLEQSVEVSVAADMLLLESSSSVGSVLSEGKVSALPLVSNNALDLIKVMGGAVPGMNPVWDADNTAFAGVRAANINVQRDGITVSDVRYPTGINASTRLNPDLVGEFKMVLSPVDAEVGRGSGQVQIMTRSGTNAYHGAVVWNIRNSALDANTWYNNAYKIVPPYSNQNEYSISAGGPIIKNKTFFFVLWNQQLTLQRAAINPIVLTPCAQKGIFRYYDSWNNGNALQNTTGGGTPAIAVVNLNGTPKPPATNPDGTSHNGILRYYSVFAPLANTPNTQDCSDAQYVQGAATWDKYRTGRDPTEWLDKTFVSLMPLPPNNYEVGDGLNTAGYRWNRRLHGASNLWGIGEDNNRKQINVRIDHNLNAGNRISGSWSYDNQWADDSFVNWPTAYGGRNELKPMVLTTSFTSTLRPNLLNEFRFGMSRTGTNVYMPLEAPGSAEALKPLFPEIDGLTTLVGLGNAAWNNAGSNFQLASTSHFYGTSGIVPITDRDTSPRWSFGDTLNWTKGRHAFKGGAEVRFASSEELVKGTWAGAVVYPYAIGGSTTAAAMGSNAKPPGMTGTSNASGNLYNMESLANFLSGSIGQFREYYFINSPTQTSWSDPRKESGQLRNIYGKELSFFFKDDWKVSDSLTLNLGVRYDYYGVPHIKSGLTAGLDGGANALFGPGQGFDNWMVPGAGDQSFMTELIFTGPNSPNPDLKAYNGDRNNFGPAVGFSWQLPWFGKGRTTMRGGYQMSYLPNGRMGDFAPILGNAPGMTYTSNWAGQDWGTGSKPYLNLTNVPNASLVPIAPGVAPLLPIPKTDRTQTMPAIDPNLASPYIQNLTLAVTRSIGTNLTVDVRYIGTLTRKLSGNMNVNIPNFLNNGLKDAFNAARSGGESALLDTMFQGIAPAGVSGAQYLRTTFIWAPQVYIYTPATTSLANGDYQTLANTLNAWNGCAPGASNGCLFHNRSLPENFIKTNPQFSTANWYSNYGNSNYNGLQAQVTLRPTSGVSFQGTYTWSRNLGYDTNSGFTNPMDRRADYTLLSMHRSHTFTTYGTWDLPFGPNQPLFNSTNGVISRIAGGWQLSWTGNVSTGMPTTIGSQSMLYGRGVPDVVGSFDPQDINNVWNHGAISGNYFGYTAQNQTKYLKKKDPQCTNGSIVTTSLQGSCTLNAIYDATSGQPVLVNPMPGTRGNLGLMNLFMPTVWNADMAMNKVIRITEGTRLSLRVDAVNVFNHVVVSGWGDIRTRRTTQRVDTAGPPDVLLTSADPFGYLPAKVGARMFQARVRFDF